MVVVFRSLLCDVRFSLFDFRFSDLTFPKVEIRNSKFGRAKA